MIARSNHRLGGWRAEPGPCRTGLDGSGMLGAMEALLHRIEALPRPGEYAVVVVPDGAAECTVVMTVADGQVIAPPAMLPAGWSTDSPSFQAAAAVVLAMDRARTVVPGRARLVDVAGGWDVSLGNVTTAADGSVQCVAHGSMNAAEGVFSCPECGARAQLSAPDPA